MKKEESIAEEEEPCPFGVFESSHEPTAPPATSSWDAEEEMRKKKHQEMFGDPDEVDEVTPTDEP